jgi:hypothetical protein
MQIVVKVANFWSVLVSQAWIKKYQEISTSVFSNRPLMTDSLRDDKS